MLPRKLQGGETIFTTMSQMALEYKAINLGQGFPDFNPDRELLQLVDKAMKEGHNQYTHLQGALSLREAIAAKVQSLYHTHINAQTEICITPGATYGIYNALTTILQPGDEVIIFEPAYDSYVPNILINGAKPVPIPLSYPSFSIDWDRVRAALTSRTKAIIINNPHNPSGSLLQAADLNELSDIVLYNKLYLVSDEVYEHIVFDEMRHESILRYPGLMQRSFIVFSFGKVYHCTGWKTGYCIAPEVLMQEFLKVHQYNAFCCFSPVQYALAAFLQKEDQYLLLGSFYEQKRNLLASLLTACGFKPVPSHGSFFQLFDYADLSRANDLEFASEITRRAGVSAIPVSPFYSSPIDSKILRFCFAKKDSTLKEAGDRLKNYFLNIP